MSDQTILTPQGKKKLEQELAELKAKRPAISDKIAAAREHGDLSENAEYHEARDEQGFNEGRIQEIEAVLKDAKVVSKQDNSIVGVGSKIKIQQDDREMEYTIVGATESDPSQGKISCESPLGIAFLGKKVGDQVEVKTPTGKLKYTIKEIQ